MHTARDKLTSTLHNQTVQVHGKWYLAEALAFWLKMAQPVIGAIRQISTNLELFMIFIFSII